MKWHVQRSDLGGYGTACLSVVLMLLIKMLVAPVLDPRDWPYLFTIFPVLLATWVGGWGPGLFATFLTALSVDLLFLDFSGTANVPGQPTAAARAGIFVLQSVILTGIVAMLRTARHRSARSDERFNLLAAGARDAALVMLDPSGRIVEWNAGANRTYGYSASELIGKPHETLYSELDRREGRAALELTTARSGPVFFEAWQIRRDGTRFWAELLVTPLIGPRGGLRGYSHLARDVTARRRIEARLTAEHAVTRILARSQLLEDAVPQILKAIRESLDAVVAVMWLKEGSATSLSFMAADSADHSAPVQAFINLSRTMTISLAEGLTGRVWEKQEAMCFPDLLHDPKFRRTDAARAAGMCGAVVFPIMSGQVFLGAVELFVTWPMQSDDMLLDMMKAMGLEIGQFVQRSRAELRIDELKQNLEHRERQYRASFELAAVGKAFLEPGTAQFVRVNHKLSEMLDIETSELTTMTLHDVVHEEDRIAVAAVMRRITEGKLDDFHTQLRLMRRTGQVIWATMSATLVRTPAALPEHIVTIIQDVTARMLAEQELAQYRNRLEDLVFERTAALQETNQRLRLSERMASLGTLSAGLGHDMGNLLLPVKLRLETMALKGIPENLREDVGAISTCAEYLQRLSNGLRLLSIDPEGSLVAPRRTDLKEWWVDVESFFRNALPRHVELERHFEPDLPPVAVAKHRLTQAVFNLVQNAGDAIKAGEAGRVRIWADCSPCRTKIRIGVTDNGIGMTAEIKSRCTEPFFTSKIRGISTGLGLSLVHSVVQQAAGTMTIDSEPGKGATFILTFHSALAEEKASVPEDHHATLPALVTIEHDRLRHVAISVLRGQHVPVIDQPLASNGHARLWICDPPRFDSKAAASFLSGRDDRRVIVLGRVPDEFHQRGVIELSGQVKNSAIRQAIHSILMELDGVGKGPTDS